MIPLARTDNLLTQEIGNELIIYDQNNNNSHCLNPIAARVWELCDGNNMINDIAVLLENELGVINKPDVDMRGLVYLALEELERSNLIKEYLKRPIGSSQNTISRRAVVRSGMLVSGAAIGFIFPLVKSILAPTPAMAQTCIEEIGGCERVDDSATSSCRPTRSNGCRGTCQNIRGTCRCCKD